MTEIRYGDLVAQPGTNQVTGMGTGLNDGWQVVARLPESALPAGVGRYALFVTGKICNAVRSGAVPQRGVMQVALGIVSGGSVAVSTFQFQNVSAREQLGPQEGIPFMLVMLQQASPAISDPFVGATWTNGIGAEFAIVARTYWNTDPTAYAVQFDVTDVSWLWLDMDRIPAGDVLASEFRPSPSQSLTSSLAGIHLGTGNPASGSGQKFLHLQAITYEPALGGFGTVPAPSFQFGWSSTAGSFSGFTARVGTNGRWGQGRNSPVAGQNDVVLSQGCFWYDVSPAGVYLVGVRGQDRGSFGSNATKIRRSVQVSLKLDNLLDVLAFATDSVANATCSLLLPFPAFPNVYIPLERPATGIVSTPSVLVHGIVQTTGNQSFEPVIASNLGSIFDWFDAYALADAGRFEGVSAMAFGVTGLAAGQPDIQYRAIFLGGPTGPSATLEVRDVSIVQLNFVRDPENIPAIPPTPGPPLVLSPGRESASPATLLPLPYAPDASMPEDPAAEMAAITGETGYRRRWPLFARVRRSIPLRWSSISEAKRDALLTFLAANRAFQFKPHGELAPVALLQESEVTSGQTVGVCWLQVQCVELIWTL